MEWVDPRQVLVGLRRVECKLPREMDERERRLRTNKLKMWREARLAALFSFGIGDRVLHVQTLLSKAQQRDFDFVMRWRIDDVDYFYPAQLKELPPDNIDSKVTIEELYSKMEKYIGPDDLSVVICLNRRMHFKFEPWSGPSKPRVKEVWYLGCLNSAQTRWFLYGDVLKKYPRKYEFDYPKGEPSIA